MTAEMIVLAGGGTGGHLFPGLAVAREFIRRDKSRSAVVVGTGRAVERRAVAGTGYQLRLLAARPLRGVDVKEQALSLASIPIALAQSAALMAQLHPAVVVGLGGYASGPVVMAAAGSLIPTALMEQNAIPGSTNRILGRMRMVRRAYLTFEAGSQYFSPRAVRVLGNPVRRGLIGVVNSPLASKPRSVLVLGGSQGAQRLNLNVPEALALAGAGHKNVRITHQSGDAMAEAVKRRYDDLGLHARVVPFIDDMAAAYRDASLVVSRAGATTLAELAVVGRPSILVPYPFAIDDHQRKNSLELERAGAAVVVNDFEATADRLAHLLVKLLFNDGERLEAMAAAAKRLGRPDATQRVVDDLEELIGVR